MTLGEIRQNITGYIQAKNQPVFRSTPYASPLGCKVPGKLPLRSGGVVLHSAADTPLACPQIDQKPLNSERHVGGILAMRHACLRASFQYFATYPEVTNENEEL
jgi:hypothetical protein